MLVVTRRGLIKSFLGIGGGLALTGAGGAVYGTRLETEWLKLERVVLWVPNLPSPLQGFRIALLSDFHLYPNTRLEFIAEAVEKASVLKVDLAVLTGDFVQKDAEAIFDLAPVLGRLQARLGTFCVLGNHDYWKGPRLVRRILEKEGMPVLVNQGLMLSYETEPLYLAGVDDTWCGRPDLSEAMRGHREGVVTILLSHEPDPADHFSLDDRVTIQLSGHSHGGQVRIPGLGSPFLPPFGRKYDLGLYRVRDMLLYTNPGIGVTAPIRLNCRPEITELKLMRAEGIDGKNRPRRS